MNISPLDPAFAPPTVPLLSTNASETLQTVFTGENILPVIALPTPDSSIQGSASAASNPPVNRPQCSHVWGNSFACLTMQQTIELADSVIGNGRPEYFITANLNYLMLSSQSHRLREINRQCCCIVADGTPIVARSRFSDRPLPERVTGADMIINLAKLAAEKGYRIFFLGGAEGVADAAAEALRRLFPDLQVAGTLCPPFRPLNSQEHAEMIESIRSSQADVLLVAFGQPKGEIWIADHFQELNIPLSIQLGASFDFLAGTARRAPRIWQAVGCEWLYRALSDPKRLVPRYWKNMLFLAQLIQKDVREYSRSKWNRVNQRLPQHFSSDR
jgi:N-acetylglucosaminyldiphosphoundecaprenol N-acetyl-beta-D-mannosaminyltransferase